MPVSVFSAVFEDFFEEHIALEDFVDGPFNSLTQFEPGKPHLRLDFLDVLFPLGGQLQVLRLLEHVVDRVLVVEWLLVVVLLQLLL